MSPPRSSPWRPRAWRCAAPASPGDGTGGAGTAVVIATAFGPSTNTEALLKQILFEGPEAASPSLFMESVANAPAAQIAIALQGARGRASRSASARPGRCSPSARAAAEIAAGRARRVLAGAVDEMTPLLHALLDRFGALARAEPAATSWRGPSTAAATASWPARGRRWWCWRAPRRSPAGAGARSPGSWPGGAPSIPRRRPPAGDRGAPALARGLRRTLDRAGLAPADVDLIVSGASGSRDGDRLEARVLRAAWGGTPAAARSPLPRRSPASTAAASWARRCWRRPARRSGPTPGLAESPIPSWGSSPLGGSPLPPPVHRPRHQPGGGRRGGVGAAGRGVG